jgi:hypothetical protein
VIHDFETPRSIAGGDLIPVFGKAARLGLVNVRPEHEQGISMMGAIPDKEGWSVARSSSLRLEELGPHLPRMARASIVPDVVDLIPSSSWCASLANMLVPSSWRMLREVTHLRAGGCQDCGSRDRIECHESWSYDESAGVQTLRGLVALCSACHETRHLGFASVRGRYAFALSRLVAINRIERHEVAGYEALIFQRFERRSRMDWSLDLSMLRGKGLSLKKTFELVSDDVIEGEGRGGIVATRIVGVSIDQMPKGLVLV